MRFRAVIFDLDGVLVSTDEQHYQGWKALCERLSIPFDREANNRFCGVSFMACIDILEELSGRSFTPEQKLEYAHNAGMAAAHGCGDYVLSGFGGLLDI